jgi:hypothetical protein
MAKIRLPSERLANCCWLPRIADKARSLLAGDLPFLYRAAFGSPIGVDGFFLRHFQIARGDFVRAVRASADDAALADWFLAQPHVDAATIEVWNQLAPNLGRKGFPARGIFLFCGRILYPHTIRRPVGSMFEAIAQDEP